MLGQHDAVFVDDEPNCEAELPDASRDFGDLLLGMGVRIRGMRRSIPTAACLIWLVTIWLPKTRALHIPPYRTTISNVLAILKRSST